MNKLFTLPTVLALLLLPTTVFASSSGDTCTASHFGTTKISSNGTAIIACMRDADGGETYSWKSMMGSTGGSVPVGTIIAWPSNTLPATEDGVQKWAKCNGTTFSSATYPDLYAVLGTTTLPNYSGMFLRGYGSQTYTDSYGTVTHASGAIGATQGDTIRNITGSTEGHHGSGWGQNAVEGGTGALSVIRGGKPRQRDSSGAKPASGVAFDASKVVPTSTENRPVNKAVVYLMRVLP